MKTIDRVRPDIHHHYSDLRPAISVDASRMRGPGEAGPIDRPPGGNYLYRNFQGASWHLARRMLSFEDLLIAKLEGHPEGGDPMPLRQRAPTWLQVLRGLDLGVAAAVLSISAAGGIPVTSCNAGSLGGHHMECLPVVAFHWDPAKLMPLKLCVRQAGLSMWVHEQGELVIGADYIRRMLLFAEAMQQRQHLF